MKGFLIITNEGSYITFAVTELQARTWFDTFGKKEEILSCNEVNYDCLYKIR